MMQKIWFIKIDGHQEGPFSVEDLKKDSRLTPDTLAWKEGFERWKPLREISELKILFQDEEGSQNEPTQEETERKKAPQDEIVLEMGEEPPYFFWILIATIVITYVLTQLYWK